jgi:hypothetical protein
MIGQILKVKQKQKPIWTVKKNIPEVTNSWHNYMCKSVIQEFQHSVLEVYDRPYTEVATSLMPTLNYTFTTGYSQVII